MTDPIPRSVRRESLRRQQGAALVITTLIMLLVAMLALTSIRDS